MTKRERKKAPDSAPVSSVYLPADVYDRLLELVRWVDSTPAYINLPDHTWETISEELDGPLYEVLEHAGVDCDDWYISPETEGDGLVALFTHADDRGEAPARRVPIVRVTLEGGETT